MKSLSFTLSILSLGALLVGVLHSQVKSSNAATSVCGSVPSGMKPTGSTRNFIDSFSGAWGDWQGPPSFGSDKVCRVFNQHSHNVTRAVSFQYEVVPNK